MSVLYLVRHGQTDLSDGIYDHLTTKGRIQCEGLGRYWLDQDRRPDHVFVGPRRRHRESAEAASLGARERSTDWPEGIELPEFDEYAAGAVIRHALETGGHLDDKLEAAAHGFLHGSPDPNVDFEQMFQKLTLAWVRGEIAPPRAEPFPDFRKRVEGGLTRLMALVGSGSSAVIFTSAGPVAAAIGMVLGLEHERALELSWSVRNSATSELLFSGDRISLNTFNGIEHLTDPVLITHR